MSQSGPMSPAIVKVISALWGDKIVELSLLAKSTRNQSHGLGHRDLALGIKGEGRRGWTCITFHRGSPGVWELPEHCGW